jgi:hypothetical protein
MVFAYVEYHLFGGNEMLAAFYMWKWSLRIVYMTIRRIVGPNMTDCGVDQSRLTHLLPTNNHLMCLNLIRLCRLKLC